MRFLFHGNNIVVNRLAAGENGHLRRGTPFREHLGGFLGVLLGNIFAKVEGDEFGLPLQGVRRQFFQRTQPARSQRRVPAAKLRGRARAYSQRTPVSRAKAPFCRGL